MFMFLRPLQRNGYEHAYTHSLAFLYLSDSLTLLYMCNVSSFWLAFVTIIQRAVLLRRGYRNLLDGWAIVF